MSAVRVDFRGGETPVRTCKIFLYDRRRRTPSLHLVKAKDQLMARAIVDELLDESVNYVTIELWDGKRRVYASARP